MDLDAYLTRIGFCGFPQADLTTLRSLQRCHLEHIAFENFDVQFGRNVTLKLEDAYSKLVTDRRGGWCDPAATARPRRRGDRVKHPPGPAMTLGDDHEQR
jgi:hypothetical protein